jgi:hypothetical protein
MEVEMQKASIRLTVRATAAIMAILFSGAAIAAQKNGSEAAIASCMDKAVLQFNIDNANCYMYPVIAPQYGECMVQAQLNYAKASAACSTAAIGTLNRSMSTHVQRTLLSAGR